MRGFLNLFTAMSLRESMKPQATTKQIQNTEHGIRTKAFNRRLVLKRFEAG